VGGMRLEDRDCGLVPLGRLAAVACSQNRQRSGSQNRQRSGFRGRAAKRSRKLGRVQGVTWCMVSLAGSHFTVSTVQGAASVVRLLLVGSHTK